MVQEMVMMLSFCPSWVVTRTTGPDSIRVKALLKFSVGMRSPVDSPVADEDDTMRILAFACSIGNQPHAPSSSRPGRPTRRRHDPIHAEVHDKLTVVIRCVPDR